MRVALKEDVLSPTPPLSRSLTLAEPSDSSATTSLAKTPRVSAGKSPVSVAATSAGPVPALEAVSIGSPAVAEDRAPLGLAVDEFQPRRRRAGEPGAYDLSMQTLIDDLSRLRQRSLLHVEEQSPTHNESHVSLLQQSGSEHTDSRRVLPAKANRA